MDLILKFIPLKQRTQMGVHLSVTMDEFGVSPWELAKRAGVPEFYVLYRMVRASDISDIRYLLRVLEQFEPPIRVEKPKMRRINIRLSDEEEDRFVELCGSVDPDKVVAQLWQEHKRRLNDGRHSQY